MISGGAEGAVYVRQLLRAARAGKLAALRIDVIDRAPGCAAVREFGADSQVRFVVADWVDWLETQLDALPQGAQLVPYHWAPHVLLDWLSRQVARAGGLAVRGAPLARRGLPFEASVAHGDQALSYAAWLCPPTCIEPALCPHTRGEKSWSLATDLAAAHAPDAVDGRIVFKSLHFAYGVSTIPVADILAGRDAVVSGLAAGSRTYLVATSSHCHALATTLRVERDGPRAA